MAKFKGYQGNTQQYIEFLLSSMKYRISSSKSPDTLGQQLQFYNNLINEMEQNEEIKFNLWTIFEDDIELIIAKLKSELIIHQQSFSSTSEETVSEHAI